MSFLLLKTRRRTGNGSDGAVAPSHCDGCAILGDGFCRTLDARGLAELRAIATPVRIPAGCLLIQEGDPLEHVFCVTRGMMKIYRSLPDDRTQITGFLTCGDILGLPGRDEAGCSAETVSDVEACLFDRPRFEHLLEAHPELELRLLVMANDEIRIQHEHLLLLGRKNAEERLASFLLMLAHRKRVNGTIPNLVDLPMSRRDIADYLGLTVESVSRTLSRFRSRGLIEAGPRDRAILLRTAALEALSNVERYPSGHVALGL